LHTAARLGAGETILVTGSAGGVGSSVVQLARWMGATSIGIDRAQADDFLPDHLRARLLARDGDEVSSKGHRRDDFGGRGVDVVYDTFSRLRLRRRSVSLSRRLRMRIDFGVTSTSSSSSMNSIARSSDISSGGESGRCRRCPRRACW
jgi:NADPH:quinone reductase-like Zn-dependent oxidoreductase